MCKDVIHLQWKTYIQGIVGGEYNPYVTLW